MALTVDQRTRLLTLVSYLFCLGYRRWLRASHSAGNDGNEEIKCLAIDWLIYSKQLWEFAEKKFIYKFEENSAENEKLFNQKISFQTDKLPSIFPLLFVKNLLFPLHTLSSTIFWLSHLFSMNWIIGLWKDWKAQKSVDVHHTLIEQFAFFKTKKKWKRKKFSRRGKRCCHDML